MDSPRRAGTALVHELTQGRRETGRDASATFLARMDRCDPEPLHDISVLASDDGRRDAAERVVHGECRVADTGLPPARGQRYMPPGGAFFDIRASTSATAASPRVSNDCTLEGWLRQAGCADAARAQGVVMPATRSIASTRFTSQHVAL